MSFSDLPKLWTISSNISKFVLSKSFFCVENKLNISEKKKKSVKNIWLGDEVILMKFFENFDF